VPDPPPPLRVAVIPGDGIGTTVTAAACEALTAALAATSRRPCALTPFDWSSARYLEHGAYIPEGGLDALREHDAILFGAVGWPTVPDHVSLWGLRLAICQGFDQGVCVRPARLLPGVRSPLRDRGAAELECVVVRENTEGEYAGVGGRVHAGLPGELAVQATVVTRAAVERVARHAFALAASRPARHLVSVTKSNASPHASVLWDEVVAAVGAGFPDVALESVLVDAMAARLVLRPDTVDVLVASNLHADVLSDLTAALVGGLGVAPSANLSCDARFPSMFEPVHGSAPDLADPGLANPVGAMLSAAMLLDHVGEAAAAKRLREAVDRACADGVRTPDAGGRARAGEVTAAVLAALA
jgi:tartrate dehydrogenase/decarboxylase / D-malate dehydrogenase